MQRHNKFASQFISDSGKQLATIPILWSKHLHAWCYTILWHDYFSKALLKMLWLQVSLWTKYRPKDHDVTQQRCSWPAIIGIIFHRFLHPNIQQSKMVCPKPIRKFWHTLDCLLSSSWPTVVSNWHRHSRLSSSCVRSNLRRHSCMIASVSIRNLYSSPINLQEDIQPV